MDWLTFTSQFAASIAWPITAIVALIILRRELRSLMPFLKRLKAGPLEAEFERVLQEISADVVADKSGIEAAPLPQDDILYRLAQINPRSAILESWLRIESLARRAAIHNAGSPVPDVSTSLKAIRELTKNSLVSAEEAALFHDLRGLRNQAAHSALDVTESLAVEYIHLASTLESKLDRLASRE